jgi:hypothetical protein
MAPRRQRSAKAMLGLTWLVVVLVIQVFGFVGQEVAREGRVKPTHEMEHKGSEGGRLPKTSPGASPDSKPREVPAAGEAKEDKQDGSKAFALLTGGQRTGARVVSVARAVASKVPEAHIRAAEECLEERCTIAEISDLAGLLARDETMLQGRLARAGGTAEGSWMSELVLTLHTLREHLEEKLRERPVGYIPFGKGLTGGFFRARVH